ncbi:MAG: hypothetical protein ACTH88_04605, partial [Psychrobacter celer]
ELANIIRPEVNTAAVNTCSFIVVPSSLLLILLCLVSFSWLRNVDDVPFTVRYQKLSGQERYL